MLRASISSSLLFVSGIASAFPLAGGLSSRLLINGKDQGVMPAGKTARWDFEFIDPAMGHAPHHFHEMHAKPMHLIVISEDFSQFAHVHPDYDMSQHMLPFNITANSNSKDPDNFQLPNAVPLSGKYFLFGEVMPMDYGMLIFPYDLQATGKARPLQPIEADARESDGSINKIFHTDNGDYRLVLNVEALDHCGIVLPKLNLTLESKNAQGTFVPVTDLDTWLESYGHAVVAGVKGNIASEKSVQHLHAVWPIANPDPKDDSERGPSLELAAHAHTRSAPSDRYRAWVQFKHHGKVLTFVFTFDWDLKSASRNATHGFCL